MAPREAIFLLEKAVDIQNLLAARQTMVGTLAARGAPGSAHFLKCRPLTYAAMRLSETLDHFIFFVLRAQPFSASKNRRLCCIEISTSRDHSRDHSESRNTRLSREILEARLRTGKITATSEVEVKGPRLPRGKGKRAAGPQR